MEHEGWRLGSGNATAVARVHGVGDAAILEIVENVDNAIGTILVGDLNVHNKGWLRFSGGTPPEGTVNVYFKFVPNMVLLNARAVRHEAITYWIWF